MFANKKGFTLLEILVVVLIIGILAAIALPKYETAVAKSQFATLKQLTKSYAQAIYDYRLSSGKEPLSPDVLSVSLPIQKVDYEHSTNWTARFKNGHFCFVINTTTPKQVACYLKNQKMRYYFNSETLRPIACLSLRNYKGGIKVCEQETNHVSYTSGRCGVDFANTGTISVVDCNSYEYN